jgi:gamma-glutamyltranspeptidase/glutathione hydrolase
LLNYDPAYYPYPSKRNLVYASRGLCASSHPLATQAGLTVLRRGGNAVDAALAIAAALTVVDPANNGPGGDCFAIISQKGKLYGLNSSGFSPALFDLDEVKRQGHAALPFAGWLPVTVPGAPKGWAELNRRFSKLSLEECFAPALELAKGYALSPDNAPILNGMTAQIEKSGLPEVGGWLHAFNPGGKRFRAGDIYALPELGQTLSRIAKTNAEDFYAGQTAELIDAFAKKTGGWLRAGDLAAYEARWVDPLRVNYKGVDVWELPPNGQGLTALVALNILENLPVSGPQSEESLHLQMEAIKLAFADALNYVADPAFMRLSPKALLSKEYAQNRAALIGETAKEYAFGSPSKGDTVYFCAADGEGNMISMIQSLYQGFGSRVTVPGTGVALQDRGACFSMREGHANLAAPRKYPYHTIIPAFLTKGEEPLGPFGIMGGYMQPQAHTQVAMNLIDFCQNPQAALDAPRFCWTEGLRFNMEPGFNPATVAALERRGHQISVLANGGYGRGQIILSTGRGSLAGATEPRADGSVIGF